MKKLSYKLENSLSEEQEDDLSAFKIGHFMKE